ncbi:MAG TPA: hypothetical protein VGD64_08385 [Acidisarcina sp.]
MPELNLTFPHSWTAEVLDKRPLILPARQYVYPQQVEEVERGALELLIRPAPVSDASLAPPFLATCALGFADPAVPTGIWSCPHPAWLCALAGGYAYLINTAQPDQWKQIEYRPVLTVRPLPDHGLILFAGHQSITAWNAAGEAWQSARLSWEGIKILAVEGTKLTGAGWDLMTDREVDFSLDLLTGEHSGGVRR